MENTLNAFVYHCGQASKFAASVTPEPISATVLRILSFVCSEYQKIPAFKRQRKRLEDTFSDLESILQDITTKEGSDSHKDLKETLEQLYEFLLQCAAYNRLEIWWKYSAISKALTNFSEELNMKMTENSAQMSFRVIKLSRAISEHARPAEIPESGEQNDARSIKLNPYNSEATHTPVSIVRKEYCDNPRYVGKAYRCCNNELGFVNQQYRKCIEYFKGLEHTNVMKAFTILVMSSDVYFVSTYHKLGNISKFCAKVDCKYFNVYTLLAGAADGLAYMHAQGFVHGHMRNSNILITNDKHAVIHDFECARFLEHEDQDIHITEEQRLFLEKIRTCHKADNAVRWMSPEFATASRQIASTYVLTPEDDIWAFGMVIVALIAGAEGRPYDERRNPREVFIALEEYTLPLIADPDMWYPWISEELKNLAFECFTCAERRPSMEDVRERLQRLADSYVSPLE